jgi:hypothetical protein
MQKIRLAYPKDRGTITPNRCRLQWNPMRGIYRNEKLLYTVAIYATRRGRRPGRRTKPLPIFTTKMLKRNFFDLPIRDKGLKSGRTYWWRVRATNKDGQIVALSNMRRFRVKKPRVPVEDIMLESPIPHEALYVLPEDMGTVAAESWWSHRENMLPCPPVAWGKPVKLRWRSELESDPAEPGAPGSTEPLAMVWGNEAAEIYLPAYLVQHANLYWDLSHIDGCEQVMLQVSGNDGFSEPNDGDVMEDENLINYYWGPPRTSCGASEIETPSGGPPIASLILASNLDLYSDRLGGEPVLPPSEFSPEVIRQIRTIPCNDSREPVDVASDPVTIRCVRNPVIDITAMTVDYSWGENPSRVIDFALMFEERFPNVRVLPPPSAPCTLLIYTPPGPSMMDHSSCSNLSLTMNGEPVHSQNSIGLLNGGNYNDTYVIHLPEWPSEPGWDCRLEQQWDGGILHQTLWDFLTPKVLAAIIPGVHPSWLYCGGVFGDYDSLYGRDDLPEDFTNSPYYYYISYTGHCLSRDFTGDFLPPPTGIEEFNGFMERTYRGTRTVTHDERIADFHLHEPEGTQDVEVQFYTENTNDLRFIMYSVTQPVMMREIRDSGEVLWEVKYMDGHAAGLYATGDHVGVYYGGRPGYGWGRSQFDPPRLQIWLSVGAGANADGFLTQADIYYDLTAV